MVKLPYGFVKTYHKGYYWNVPEQRLYSLKIGGELRPMKRVRYVGTSRHDNRYQRRFIDFDGYCLSKKGKTYCVNHHRFLKYNEDLDKEQFVPVGGSK
jgi:hypothetical protein